MPALSSLTLPLRLPARRSNRRKWLHPLACFFLVLSTSLMSAILHEHLLIHVANGILLAYLLVVPRRSWPVFLAAALAASITTAVLLQTPITYRLLLIPRHCTEVLISALLLRRRSAELPKFTNPFYLLRFSTCALIVPPLVVNLVGSMAITLMSKAQFISSFGRNFLSDSLGILVATPACVAFFRSWTRRSKERKGWLVVFPIFGFMILILGQTDLEAPELLVPVLLVILLRMGIGWAAMCALGATMISALFTGNGMGPFAAHSGSILPTIRLQVFSVVNIVVIYGVNVVIENLRATQRRLEQIAALHLLVAENSRDVIMLRDFDGRRTMIASPKVFWGGWTREEFAAAKPLTLIHPEDREKTLKMVKKLRSGDDGALLELRVRGKDGTYGWVESNLRTVRDTVTNLPTGILFSVREINERKHAEQQLEDAYRAVEILATTDPLTGLANRREFDRTLAAEWRRALREQRPISILVVDVDHFKDYNDTYGHPHGDVCLKEIAAAVCTGATRASDLAARIGGEEFAILLPNTADRGARRIAQLVCEAVRARAVAHQNSPSGVVTVSVGSATLIPQPGQNSLDLFARSDQALYQAKRSGRNQAFPAVDERQNQKELACLTA